MVSKEEGGRSSYFWKEPVDARALIDRYERYFLPTTVIYLLSPVMQPHNSSNAQEGRVVSYKMIQETYLAVLINQSEPFDLATYLTPAVANYCHAALARYFTRVLAECKDQQQVEAVAAATLADGLGFALQLSPPGTPKAAVEAAVNAIWEQVCEARLPHDPNSSIRFQRRP